MASNIVALLTKPQRLNAGSALASGGVAPQPPRGQGKTFPEKQTGKFPTSGGPKPPTRPAGGPGAAITPGGFNPVTSSFGLNLNDRTPFNPLNPDVNTVGGFNKLLLQMSQPQYLPQLQGLQGQMQAETAANTQRTGDINDIYKQYQQQAQDAYNQVQQSLANLAAEAGPGTSQANLSAALSSAMGGQNSLAQMMGMSGPSTAQETLPYLGAAQAAQAATGQSLATSGAGALGLQGENLANVGEERATEQNTESLRHGAAEQGLQQQQQALVEQIPGIIAQARQQLISDLQSGQSLAFQQNLAARQFGLQAQSQAFNQQQTSKQFRETQVNDAANRAAQAAQIRQNAQALKNQEAATAAATAQALAKTQGQAQQNALKYLQGAITPTKNDMGTFTDSNGNKYTALRNPGAWHVDVGSILKTMIDQYGITQQEALQMMGDIGGSTYVSGQGGQTVAQWANTYLQRQRAQSIPPKPGPLQTGWGNILGGITKGIGSTRVG